ncbi:hypothetical protein BDN72DRAFT_677212 [Pluteus cervinus]|uniref:Uncharacterized protein n=1 Tax=Pluteus cervinus TaxID=181527 RepID=A0ACD3AS16_9AGAR|nr:hypothetical protein BDN72DRAFT_677212 [Pluteus cervinus]
MNANLHTVINRRLIISIHLHQSIHNPLTMLPRTTHPLNSNTNSYIHTWTLTPQANGNKIFIPCSNVISIALATNSIRLRGPTPDIDIDRFTSVRSAGHGTTSPTNKERQLVLWSPLRLEPTRNPQKKKLPSLLLLGAIDVHTVSQVHRQRSKSHYNSRPNSLVSNAYYRQHTYIPSRPRDSRENTSGTSRLFPFPLTYPRIHPHNSPQT